MSIILGSMTFSIPYTSNKLSVDEIQDIINLYSQVNNPILDTAIYYKNDHILSQLNLNNLEVDTKINPWFNNDFESGKLGMLSKSNILKQLDTVKFNINTLYLHSPDHETPIFDTLQTCNNLYKQHRFKHLGLSNYSLTQIKEIIDVCEQYNFVKPSYYQGLYNPLCRKIEEIFPYLQSNNIHFYAYNPLAGGLLTGKYLPCNNKNTNSRFFNNAIYQNLFWKPQYLSAVQFLYDKFGDDIINKVYSWFHTLNIDMVMGISSKNQYQHNIKGICKLGDDDMKIFDNVYKNYIKIEQNYYY